MVNKECVTLYNLDKDTVQAREHVFYFCIFLGYGEQGVCNPVQPGQEYSTVYSTCVLFLYISRIW